jgi:hypothetical protein
VSLAQEILPDDEGYRAVTHIPRAVVERVVALDQAPEASAQAGDEPLHSADRERLRSHD